MKKLILLVASTALAFPAFSQSGLEVGLYAAKNQDMSATSYYTDRFPGPDGHSFGLRGAYAFKPKFKLQAGVLYTKMHNRVAANIFWCGTQPVYEPFRVAEIQSDNIEMQTAVRFTLWNDTRITPFISAGFAHFFKIRRQDYFSSVPDWIWQSSGPGYQDIYNVALLSSVGLRVNLSRRLALDLEPAVKYFPVADTNFGSRVNVCAGIGLAYKLTD